MDANIFFTDVDYDIENDDVVFEAHGGIVHPPVVTAQ